MVGVGTMVKRSTRTYQGVVEYVQVGSMLGVKIRIHGDYGVIIKIILIVQLPS
jgi:hypothetical protein